MARERCWRSPFSKTLGRRLIINALILCIFTPIFTVSLGQKPNRNVTEPSVLLVLQSAQTRSDTFLQSLQNCYSHTTATCCTIDVQCSKKYSSQTEKQRLQFDISFSYRKTISDNNKFDCHLPNTHSHSVYT